MAAEVGVRRHLSALRAGKPDRHGYAGPGWDIHIAGALGELALAKSLGRYWDGSVDTYHASGDVGELHVRTRTEPWMELIVRTDDDPNGIYVLVIAHPPASFTIVGWIRGEDAMRPEWLKQHGGREPAYFVPTDALFDMGLLDV